MLVLLPLLSLLQRTPAAMSPTKQITWNYRKATIKKNGGENGVCVAL